MKRRRIRFLHIPKTAGSTVHFVVRCKFPTKPYFVFRGNFAADCKRLRNLSQKQRCKLFYFSGHAPLRTGIQQVDDSETFTLLRNPIDRVVSFCNHALDPRKNHYVLQRGISSLDDLLDSQITELSNLTTKLLITEKTEVSDCGAIRRLDPDGAASLAIQLLEERVSFFGIQEKFDESLILFADQLGWKSPVYLRQNSRRRSFRLDMQPHHLDRIREMNAIDQMVYEFAFRRFHEVWEASPLLREKHASFSKAQRLARPALLLAAFMRGLHKRYRSSG